jgi:RNA polymerase sigma factor (sigma-70 family)
MDSVIPSKTPALTGRITERESLKDLFERVRGGDRAAAAKIFDQYRPLIRQRCRASIRPSLRGVTDSEDLWSTVARRFDAMMVRGAPSLESERAFWVLVGTLIQHAVVDRVRVLKRLERATSEDEPFAGILRARMERDVSDSDDSAILKTASDHLARPADREILKLWLCEHSHRQIAEALDMTESAVRMRWHEIRGKLRPILEGSAR